MVKQLYWQIFIQKDDFCHIILGKGLFICRNYEFRYLSINPFPHISDFSACACENISDKYGNSVVMKVLKV